MGSSKDLCSSAHVGQLSSSANDLSTVRCEQHHDLGGNTLESLSVADTDTATLAWLVGALEPARKQDQTKLVGYLEAILDDVVFEMESAARRRGYR